MSMPALCRGDAGLEQFSNALQKFGIGRLAMILAVGAGVVAALVALTMTLGREPQALLYSNLDLKEAASVTQALDQAGVKYTPSRATARRSWSAATRSPRPGCWSPARAW
jgi:flagellar biosynthesis/type III secretory pathway M-ring protein FliF/YscJ